MEKKAPRPVHGMVRYAQMLHTAAGKLKYTQETMERLTLDQLRGSTPPEIQENAKSVVKMRLHYETGTNDGHGRTYRKYPTVYNQVRIYTRSVPRMVNREYTVKKNGKDKKVRRTVPAGSGERHLSIIRFYGPPGPKTPVWVWCDCAYFQFTLEVALKDKDHTSDVYPGATPQGGKHIDEKPQVRNPGEVGYLCKHLYAASTWALGQKKDLAREKYEKEEAKKADEKETARKLTRFR